MARKSFTVTSGEPFTCSSKIKSICKRCIHKSIPKRLIFSIVGFLATSLAISMNTNLSLTIVSMVDRSNVSIAQVKTSNECLSEDINLEMSAINETRRVQHGEFHWGPETEGLALGAVYYGQAFGFLPGGRMAEICGGKRTLITFLLLSSVCTVVTPFAAEISIYTFIICRFLVGVGTAPVVPVLFFLMSRWTPESERSLTVSFILAGYGIGTFVSYITAGVLCASTYLGGWRSVFYIGGLSGLVWCLICHVFVYDSPDTHPTITTDEYGYISKHLGVIEQKQIKRIPWKSIFSSVPFWALAIGFFGQYWIIGFYSTVQTLYMGTILKLDSVTNGQLSSIPPLGRGFFACLCGYPADIALRRGYIGKGFLRKGATIINAVFSCAGFVAILLAECNTTMNAIAFSVVGLLGGFTTFGVCMAGVDLAPNLSGTISGILSFIGVIPFFIVPLVIGIVTKYERSMAQWRYAYYATIGVVVVTTTVYAIFGTSEPQPWGVWEEEPTKEDIPDVNKRKEESEDV